MHHGEETMAALVEAKEAVTGEATKAEATAAVKVAATGVAIKVEAKEDQIPGTKAEVKEAKVALEAAAPGAAIPAVEAGVAIPAGPTTAAPKEATVVHLKAVATVAAKV